MDRGIFEELIILVSSRVMDLFKYGGEDEEGNWECRGEQLLGGLVCKL